MSIQADNSLRYSKCRDIELQLARTTDDYLGAFTLAHDAAVRAGVGDPNHLSLRISPHQLLDSSQVLVAKRGERVISTHTVVADSAWGLPMEPVFPEAIGQARDSGRRLAEVCCLADRRLSPKRFFDLFSDLSRLTAQFSLHIGIDELWIACPPRQARLFSDHFGYRPRGAERAHPLVKGGRAVPLRLDLVELRDDCPHGWRRLFGEPIALRWLAPAPLPDADWAYFQKVAAGCIDAKASDAATELSVHRAAPLS